MSRMKEHMMTCKDPKCEVCHPPMNLDDVFLFVKKNLHPDHLFRDWLCYAYGYMGAYLKQTLSEEAYRTVCRTLATIYLSGYDKGDKDVIQDDINKSK